MNIFDALGLELPEDESPDTQRRILAALLALVDSGAVVRVNLLGNFRKTDSHAYAVIVIRPAAIKTRRVKALK